MPCLEYQNELKKKGTDEMNTQMIFDWDGEESCQPPSPRLRRSGCENVTRLTSKAHGTETVTNTNYQLQLGTGNIRIGNTSTMATLCRIFAQAVAGAAMVDKSSRRFG